MFICTILKFNKRYLRLWVTNLITPRALFSPIFMQTTSLFHASGADISHSLLDAKISEIALLLYKPSYSRFCLKFRCHGNRGHPGVNLNDAVKLAVPGKHTLNQTKRSGSDDPSQRYGHLKFSKWEVGRSLVGRQYTYIVGIDLIYSSSDT